MNRILIAALMVGTFHPAVWAQESPVTIAYTVSNLSIVGGTATVEMTVIPTNHGPDDLFDLSIKMPGPTGDDTEIQGELIISGLAPGESRTETGQFTAPKALFEGASFDSIFWKLTFRDAQGQVQTHLVMGAKQP